MKPIVLNQRGRSFSNAVYIGRGTKWGNPYRIKDYNNPEERLQVIELYRINELPKFSQAELETLRGRNLVCYCAPLPCHGDVLLEAANT
jgi:hypothetical protein